MFRDIYCVSISRYYIRYFYFSFSPRQISATQLTQQQALRHTPPDGYLSSSDMSSCRVCEKKLAKDPQNTSNTDSSASYQTKILKFIILSSSLFIFNHDHWPSRTQWQSQVLDFWHLQGGRHAADLSFDQGEGCGRIWWIHLNICFYVLVAFQAKSCWPF